MDLKVDIEGADKITEALRERFGGVRGRVVAALTTTLGPQTRGRAAGAAPVKTGLLRAKITAAVVASDKAVTLRVWPKKQTAKKQNYARFVEEGTLTRHAISRIRELKNKGRPAMFAMYQHQRAAGAFRTRAQPFMAPAREWLRSRVGDVLKAAVNEGLEG